MMSAQREKHLQRFASASITDVSFPDDDAGSSTNTSLCIGRDQTLALSLSVHLNAFADGVWVPRNCLEGIWSKAAELLRTEGAIVSAPGVSDGAKFVLSYRGRNPHLVVPKTGGAFACDAECANWKAMGICAHSVAVAELSSKLPKFVAWFKRTKKCPNLSKFAEATMPKGRGKKGSENPRKRKAPSETETRIVNPFTVSQQVSSQPSVSATTAFSASASSVASSFPLNVSQTNSVHLPSQSNTFQWMYPQSCCPRPVPMEHPYPYGQPSSYGQMPSPYIPPQPFVSTQPQYPPPSPFILCEISGNISVCAGCRNKYLKSRIPPDDLCTLGK